MFFFLRFCAGGALLFIMTKPILPYFTSYFYFLSSPLFGKRTARKFCSDRSVAPSITARVIGLLHLAGARGPIMNLLADPAIPYHTVHLGLLRNIGTSCWLSSSSRHRVFARSERRRLADRPDRFAPRHRCVRRDERLVYIHRTPQPTRAKKRLIGVGFEPTLCWKKIGGNVRNKF